ncbi:hypothetical protein HanXRQr2_Chr05g0237561 [Helianthus annuus]|uniref:Uncharacterized protein n=1 Tax=Helianthus annuus TaxID=4232 RepID=A0A9K3J2W0_HELAN|nr:hypothetical protein HanXRQr2_Chr05g0237561 [Helianthus annuus]KAJ0924526.1 hypothetical protein HanPSC8_Chr05g0229141 [Helianthus annuus]KAJ0924530.1 hypothetical protein HanPSC8_Chr05g0229181 [Helianthus annuus]
MMIMTIYVKNLNKSSSFSVFTYLGRFLVPLLLVLVLYVPKNINWIVDSVLYLSLWIEVTHFLIFFFNKIRTTMTWKPNLTSDPTRQQQQSSLS